MKLFAASPKRHDQPGFNEDREMFGNPLSGNVKMAAKLVQSLTIIGVELIEQRAAAGIGQGFEDVVHTRVIMQLNGCMSDCPKQIARCGFPS